MFVRETHTLPVAAAEQMVFDQVPAAPAVFAVWPRQGSPYLARTENLQRRLRRLLNTEASGGRRLNLSAVAERIEYWQAASRLEGTLLLYETARKYDPERYRVLLKLRPPALIRLLHTPWPRTHTTLRISGTGMAYGPFRTRAHAEQFERQMLDLFQIRRCDEDLAPHPEHPGCIYGEMNMCLRPCQGMVTREEYQSEVDRVSEFLSTDGRIALRTAEAARDRLSAEMEFEAAASEHRRSGRIEDLLRLREDLAREITRLNGVAVTAASEANAATLWFLCGGAWQAPVDIIVRSGDSVSLDRRLKEIVTGIQPAAVTPQEREEHLAILARWFWSSRRDGAWVGCDTFDRISYRRLSSAVSKLVHGVAPVASS